MDVRRWKTVVVAIVLAMAGSGLAITQAGTAVAAAPQVDLVLLVDGSGSIDSDDWHSQLNAIESVIYDEITVPLDGSLAIGVVQFGGDDIATGTRNEIPLTRFDSGPARDGFIRKLRAIEQMTDLTNSGDAIVAGTQVLADGGRSGAQGRLCMSTDGAPNAGAEMEEAVDYALENGVKRFSVVGIEDAAGGFLESDAHSAYDPYVFGGGHVTFAATFEELSLMVRGCFIESLRLRALEVNQTIQDWNNSVPLIRGKETIVRAFIETKQQGTSTRTSGRLHGYDSAGTELGRPVTPEFTTKPDGGFDFSGAITVTDDATTRRHRLEGSLNFRLPMHWVKHPQLKLRLELPGGMSCPADWPSDCSLTMHFDRARIAAVTFAAIDHSGKTVTNDEIGEQYWRTVDAFPIAEIDAKFWRIDWDAQPEIRPWRVGELSWPPLNSNNALAMMSGLQILNSVEDGTNSDVYHGIVAGGTPEGNYNGLSSGAAGGLLTGGRVSAFFLGESGAVGSTKEHRNLGVHELGHDFGLDHVVHSMNGTGLFTKNGWCDEDAQRLTPDWPHYSDSVGWEEYSTGYSPTIGPLGDPQTEIWGVSPRHFEPSTENLGIIDPRKTPPLMSYCASPQGNGQQTWTGKPDYVWLHEGDLAPQSVAAADTADAVDRQPATVLRGVLELETGKLQWEPSLAIRSATPTESAPGGNFELQLLGSSGEILHAVTFQPEPDEPGQPNAYFALVVPDLDAELTTMVVRKDGAEVARRDVSDSVPTVRFTSAPAVTDGKITAEWSAADADGDSLLYTVQYSTDQGGTWTAYAVDSTQPQTSIPVSTVPGAQHALLRVTASDGVRSSSVVSPAFTVPNNAPMLSVAPGLDGKTFVGVQSVILSALALDTEDGSIDNIAWTSDLEGELGTGAEVYLRADELTEGVHTITVTATDEAGAVTARTITVTIRRTADRPPVVHEVDPQSIKAIDGICPCPEMPVVTVTGENFFGTANEDLILLTPQQKSWPIIEATPTQIKFRPPYRIGQGKYVMTVQTSEGATTLTLYYYVDGPIE